MAASDDTAPNPAFLECFRARAGDGGAMPFDRFMELALYDPALGYYRHDRIRAGRSPGTDFHTASSVGPVFGELVCAAAGTLLARQNARPADFTFVEIGAEPGGGVLAGVAHPFAAARVIRVGEPSGLSGPCVVFSNELFDAQPCRRLVFRGGAWRELGVAPRAGRLVEVELAAPPSTGADGDGDGLPPLPASWHENYHLDLPLAAAGLARRIAAQPWSGLFLAFDYGKTWPELLEDTPAGTVRAYHRHRQHNDLLARPGAQDLTCHVCWDWLAGALKSAGFAPPVVERQEAFFIHHAADYLAAQTSSEPTAASPRKLALMQLLHPGNLGQKFQALHAWRESCQHLLVPDNL
jgi:SAM-dependent MidA family methyltransferase